VHIKDSITDKILAKVALKFYKALIENPLKKNEIELSKKFFRNNLNTFNAKMKIQGFS
jgi:hypothetical protein